VISLYVTSKLLSSERLEGGADLAEAQFNGVELRPIRTRIDVSKAQLIHVLDGLLTLVHLQVVHEQAYLFVSVLLS